MSIFRPTHHLLVTLTYVFGASIADYLGEPFLPDSFWLGLVAVVFLQTSMNLLPEVFRLDVEPLLENETRKARQSLRNNALYISVASLGSVALIAYILFNTDRLPPTTFYFLLLSFVIVFGYSIPPIRLINRGWGEFLLAVQIAYVVPSIAFTLRADEMHRFLALTVPLTCLAFAYFIVTNFRAFAQDRKYSRVTFLTRLGWERVVPIHHFIVGLAYILFLAAPAFGLSLSLIWQIFLILPFATFQIVQLRNISLGAPANWRMLTATALAVFGLTTYFLTLTFWIR